MPSSLTITSTDFTSFVTNTVIDPGEVNNNFSTYRGHLLPVDPNTSASADAAYDLGSTEYRFRQGHFSGTVSAAEFSGVHTGDFTGSQILGLTTVSGAYTVGENDKVVLCTNASSASYTITLPTAASVSGQEFFFKRTDDTTVSLLIDANGSETIDGTTGINLVYLNESMRIISNGSNWKIISQYVDKIIEGQKTSGEDLANVADTWEEVTGSTITVGIGTWDCGYNVTCYTGDNNFGPAFAGGDARMYNLTDSTALTATELFVGKNHQVNTNHYYALSKSTRETFNTEVNLSFQMRNLYTDLSSSRWAIPTAFSSTDPDAAQIFFARKVRL